MPNSQDLTNNDLLAAITPEARKRLSSHLQLVNLPLGEVLYETFESEVHVYFPINSIISLLHAMIDGSSAEIAVVGNEGLVGIASFMGGDSMPSRAVVPGEGFAYRITASEIRKEFNNHIDTREVFLRYTQSLIAQMAQTAACYRHHTIIQQLCRWLLLSLDRIPGNRVRMTHELIANMLGVRREGVTEAAGMLHKAGIIDYHRGLITVIDRPGLEKLSCECYKVMKRESDRLMQFTRPRIELTRRYSITPDYISPPPHESAPN